MGVGSLLTLYLLFALALLTAAIGLMPRRTEVVGTDLRVHTWLKTFHFDLKEVRAIEDIAPDALTWRTTVRIFGAGWPFKPYGWFWNRERGMLLAMVSDRSGMVLLHIGRRLLIVSPEDRRDLAQQIENRQMPG